MNDAPATDVHAIDWSAWQPTETATLLFVVRDGRILLIFKKRGLGAGKILGPGGRLEAGESPLDCAIREVREELCITPLAPRQVGRHRFEFIDGYRLLVHVFLCSEYEGIPAETDEAIPHWFKTTDIPYEKMWEDDIHWIPRMLEGELFDGRYVFSGERMLTYAFADPVDPSAW